MSETTAEYNVENADADYTYRNVPLTRDIAKDLLLELFEGETFSRSEASDMIAQSHIERGGLPYPGEDVGRSIIKPALSKLKDEGMAENPVLGYWRVLNSDMKAPQYKYHNIPLARGIAKDLLLELFEGETFSRSEVSDTIVQSHNERGGLPYPGEDVGRNIIRQALISLKRDGLAIFLTKGRRWRIFSADDPDYIELDLDDDDFEDTDTDEDIVTEDLAPHKEIGFGDSVVYIYFYPTYKAHAESKGEVVFPCKVGKTKGLAIDRVLSQSGTALPEYPEIGLSIQTDTPKDLEDLLHGALRLRGKQITEAPGVEWFLTNPKEIEEIYTFLIGD